MNLPTQWIVGFVDGEGCFHIQCNPQPSMTTGYQVLCEFVVTQHERDIKVLYALKAHFGCGVVRQEKKSIYCYRVRAHAHHRDKIVPFFEAHRLKTRKYEAFIRYRRVVLLMEAKKHLTAEGLALIRALRERNLR